MSGLGHGEGVEASKGRTSRDLAMVVGIALSKNVSSQARSKANHIEMQVRVRFIAPLFIHCRQIVRQDIPLSKAREGRSVVQVDIGRRSV